MADTYYNVVRFTPGGDDGSGDDGSDAAPSSITQPVDGGGGTPTVPGSGGGGGNGSSGSVALLLEGPWKMEPGVRPNLNRATCTYVEYAKLGGQLGITGSVGFCFTDPDEPDLKVEQVLLLDAMPIAYGAPPGGGQPIATQYRLLFSDRRYGWVEPRGGRLRCGVLNPSSAVPVPSSQTAQPTPTQKLSDLIKLCLSAMGEDDADVPSGIDSTDPPQDLRWFGTHAPTELAKLLSMAGCAAVLQPDGTLELYQLGDGDDPTIPDGRALPVTSLAGSDGRGKTVVLTSFPTQIADVVTQDQAGPGFWRFAARNAQGAWDQIDASGAYNNSSAVAEMNGGWQHTPDPTLREQAFRLVQLDPDTFDPLISPLLRKAWADPQGGNPNSTPPLPASPSTTTDDNGLPPLVDLDFRAKVAVLGPTGTWTNSADYVRLPVVATFDGNVLKLAVRLLKLPDGTSSTSDLDKVGVPINLDSDVQVRFAVGEADYDSEHSLFKPAYFYWGLSGDAAAGTQDTLLGDDAEDAMSDATAVVVPVPELVAVRYNLGSGNPFNQAALAAKCQPLAERYLQDSAKPPRVMPAVGFLDFTFNGRITGVEVDQQAVLTRFTLDAWFRPAGSYLASEFARLRDKQERHPYESQTQGVRTAMGSAGSAAPVQPLDHYTPPATALSVAWGKLVNAWTPGQGTVTLAPCGQDGTVASPPPANLSVSIYGTGDPPAMFNVSSGVVMPYLATGGGGSNASGGVLLSPPVLTIPSGSQYQVLQLGGSVGPARWDDVRVAP